MFKKILTTILIFFTILPGVAMAQTPGGVTVPQGGTGLTSIPQYGWLSGGGAGSLRLVASTSPTVGVITATSTTATSTFAGSLSIDSPTFFVDAANNRIGMGTTTPQTRVEVVETTNSLGPIFRLTNADITIAQGDPVGDIQFFSGDISTDNYRQVAGIKAIAEGNFSSQSHDTALIFSTAPAGTGVAGDSVERWRISSLGYLGGGTTTPIEKLHIDNGNIRLDGGLFSVNATGTPVSIAGIETGISIVSIQVQGETAYIGQAVAAGTCDPLTNTYTGCEVLIVDISTRAAPVIIGGIDTGAAVNDLKTNGSNILYVGNSGVAGTCSNTDSTGCEIRVYDVSNPAAPAYLTGFATSGTFRILVAGAYVIQGMSNTSGTCNTTVLTGCEIAIYGQTSSTTLDYINGLDFGNRSVNGIAVKGSLLYVAHGEATVGSITGTADFSIYDFSNPLSLNLRGTADIQNASVGGNGANSLAVAGNVAVIGTVNDTTGTACTTAPMDTCEIYLANIRNITSIATSTGMGIDVGNQVNELIIVGDTLYVANTTTTGTGCNGTDVSSCDVRMYNISSTTAITAIGGVDLGQSVNALDVKGGFMYVGTGARSGNEFNIYRLNGIWSPSATIEGLSANTFDVTESANIGGVLTVGTGLSVGNGGLHVRGETYLKGYLGVGEVDSTNPRLANWGADFSGNIDGYWAVTCINKKNAAGASCDYIFNNASTTETTNYFDIGYNSPTYNTPSYGILNIPNAGYIYNASDAPILYQAASASSTMGYHDFSTGILGSGVSRLRIDNGGNIGIGSSTPGAKFVINNAGTANTVFIEDTTSPDTTPFVIDANGNTAIGNTAPLALLDIRHPTIGTSGMLGGRTVGSFTNDQQIYAIDSYNSDTSGGGAGIQGYIRNYAYVSNGSGSYWDIGVNSGASSVNTIAMRIWGNGNVGIGTTSPTGKLHINGDLKTEVTDWTVSLDTPVVGQNTVRSGASFDNRLFVGFGDNDGEAAIYIYDGSYWMASTTFAANYNNVLSLAAYNGRLYAGLGEDDGEGDIYEYVATSSTWTLSYDGALDGVYDLEVYNGKLYAGMGNDDGEADLYVFDGTSWTLAKDFGDFSATTERVSTLEVYNGKLYIGIYDTTNTGLGDVYVFDGTSYALSFDNPNGAASSLATYNGKLYVGTQLTSGSGGQDVYVFDGVTWTLSIDFNTSFGEAARGVTALSAYAGKLYAGLGPTGTALGEIYVFDGTGWALNRNFTTDEIADFAMYQGRLFALTGNDTSEAEVWILTARTESLLATSLSNPAFNTPFGEQYQNFTKNVNILGNLGVGTSSQAYDFSVQGASANSATAGTCFRAKNANANSYTYWYFPTAGVAPTYQTNDCGGAATTTVTFD